MRAPLDPAVALATYAASAEPAAPALEPLQSGGSFTIANSVVASGGR